jgi:hypothetical protein
MMVTLALWWTAAGTFVWLILHTIGIIDGIYRARPPGWQTLSQITLGSIAAVVLWPFVVFHLLRHPQWTFKHLKRKLWGAS